MASQSHVSCHAHLESVAEVVGIRKVCLVDGWHLGTLLVAVDGDELLYVWILQQIGTRSCGWVLSVAWEVRSRDEARILGIDGYDAASVEHLTVHRGVVVDVGCEDTAAKLQNIGMLVVDIPLQL